MDFIIDERILQNVENILPDETEIVIPDDIAEIAPYCFGWNETLHRVTLPDGLRKIGEGAFWGCKNLEWINLPSSICEIGESAFSETAITSVVIPGNLSVVPSNCFEHCSLLRSVTLCQGILVISETAFADCLKLETVSFPDGLISIGWDAFANCVSLTDIRIPDTVRFIGGDAFEGCLRLADPPKAFGNYIDPDIITSKVPHITLKPVLHGHRYHIVNGSLVGNPYVKRITISGNVDSGAIQNCPNLEVVYADCFAYLDRDAFVNCPNLKYVVLPQREGEWNWPKDCPQDYYSQEIAGLRFDYGAFGNDIKPLFCPEYPLKKEYTVDGWLNKSFVDMDTYTLPESIRRIGKSAFKGCNNIRSITLHSQLEYIGDHAFANLENLESVTLEYGIHQIGNSNNDTHLHNLYYVLRPVRGLPPSDYVFYGCKKLKKVSLPDTLTHICNYAFANCISLEQIRLPEKLERLYIGVFKGCTALKEVIFPTSLKRIGVGAFSGCASLTNISIPNSVEYIDQNAFGRCSGLTSIHLPSSLKILDKGAFADCENLTEILPPRNSHRFHVMHEMLYDGRTLHTCPAGLEEAVIEPGTSRIRSHAFDGCRKLRTVIVPETVTEIEEFAFNDCDALESVILQNPDTKLHFISFCNCPKLEAPSLP